MVLVAVAVVLRMTLGSAARAGSGRAAQLASGRAVVLVGVVRMAVLVLVVAANGAGGR